MTQNVNSANTSTPDVSLQQWAAFLAVAEEGGVQHGARRIGRTHSAVSQSIRRLEAQLGVTLFNREGRSIVLNDVGRMMLKRVQRLVRMADEVEAYAETRRRGWEPFLRVAIDAAAPRALLSGAMARWAPLSRGTSLQVEKVIAEGARSASSDEGFDVVVTGEIANGVTPDVIGTVEFALAVDRAHPLARANADVDMDAILAFPQVVVGSGAEDQVDGWRAGTTRWTVPDFDTAEAMLKTGTPFATMPRERVTDSEHLVELGTRGGHVQRQLHLVFPQGARTGPAGRLLGASLREAGRERLAEVVREAQ